MAATFTRRRALLAGAAACVALPALSQRPAAAPALAVAQIFDTSPGQRDVSRDFLVGSRAAWQDLQARGGIRGRAVQHVQVEVDGSAASVQQAWRSVRDLTECVLLCGTVSDPVATRLAGLLRQESAVIAHAAPWMQDSDAEIDERTFPIFAGRGEQIAHALRTLQVSGLQEVGAVFASASEAHLYRADVAATARLLKLRLATYTAAGDLAQLGQRLGPATPAVLLFVGGTPELMDFTRGLERQARQRYVVALADVNVQTLGQAGAARTTPIIATQPVPVVTAALPVVRRYREVLARLFDEQPTALGLAGFIAARYAAGVLAEVEAAPSRASVLGAFQRRRDLDVGGFRVNFDARRRSAGFVTQSMLTGDGRVVG